ncbi:MAG: succinate dehydrogenase cytochrome b subunit [bacterium]|nr:succinate dehydrogenase cytochrome b subunit [bacterium]
MTPASVSTSRRRPWPMEFYRSAVGKKWVMAVTGIALLGFVLAHMIGNLKVYLGEGQLDSYAHFLRELLYPLLPKTVTLWLMRTGLVIAFLLHIHAAASLTLLNRRANAAYQGPRDMAVASYASRTMRWSGVIVAAFLLWHLADLTWGVTPVAPEGWTAGAVEANLVASLSRGGVAVLYIVANLLLGIHIYHGAWSLFQSLGLAHPSYNRWRRWFAQAFSAVIVIGNVSIPIAVWTGWVG